MAPRTALLLGWASLLLAGCHDFDAFPDKVAKGDRFDGASNTQDAGKEAAGASGSDPAASNDAAGAGGASGDGGSEGTRGAAGSGAGDEDAGGTLDPVDTGTGDPIEVPTIATLGESCLSPGARACVGHDDDGLLSCEAGVWTDAGRCAEGARCDTEAGPNAGSCQSIDPRCLTAAAGDAICDGSDRLRCGPDRLRTESDPCPEHKHCDDADGARCVCDDGYEDDGAGGCRDVDDCPASGACNGAGQCRDLLGGYECRCDPGYDGTGTTSCTPTQCYVCNATYPCQPMGAKDYACRGQFALWPMPDAVAGAARAPSYSVTTDTVTDNVTQLRWQRNVPNSYPGCSGNISTAGDSCTLAEAKAYCAGLTLAGLSWRVPTKIELESIVDHTKYNPAIDTTVFSTPIGSYWTVSPYTGQSGNVFGVNFAGGNTSWAEEWRFYRVRCVH